MANITSVVADPFIPEVWANTALEVLRSRSVLARIVTRDSDVAAFSEGDVLHIPYPGTFTANNKTANTAVTLQTPTGSQVNVTLNKHKEVSFLFEDFARAVAQGQTMERYMGAMVEPLARAIEDDLFALYAGLSGTVGASGTDVGAATVRAAWKKLSDQLCPPGDRHLVVSTKDAMALLGDSSLQQFFAFNEGMRGDITRGEISQNLYGFKVWWSDRVPVVAGTPNSTKNLALDPGALILAMRGLPEPPEGTGARSVSIRDELSGLVLRVTTSYNPDHLGVQVTLDVLYGVAELRDEKGITVLA